jgi:threonylcarbamoyladenosine tRNA methylthiotransferase MtaB
LKIWSFTFGCKVNQYETELLRHRLTGPGDIHVAKPADADLCLINTCSVTAFADKECRQLIRRVLRENPTARTIVTGCYATRAPKEVQAISERVEVYTNQQKDELPSCVGYEVADRPLGIHQFAGRTRAFLKIQDGCKAPCNYCIIPTVRPDLSSKPFEQVMAEAEALLANGYQELVLTGIRLGLYRGKTSAGEKLDLVDLLRKLVAIPKKFRIRLSSLEVTEVTDRLIEFVKANPKICRHFHIPMQSGDSEVLAAMQRWYDAPFYESRIRAVRQAMPDCGITADVMVGYPAETDERFLNTAQFIENLELSGLHVFRFSAREGTKAAELRPLDPQVVSKRAGILGELDRKLRERFYRRFAGQVRETLPEPSGEGWTDNYIRVQVELAEISEGLSHRRVWSPEYEPIRPAMTEKEKIKL